MLAVTIGAFVLSILAGVVGMLGMEKHASGASRLIFGVLLAAALFYFGYVWAGASMASLFVITK